MTDQLDEACTANIDVQTARRRHAPIRLAVDDEKYLGTGGKHTIGVLACSRCVEPIWLVDGGGVSEVVWRWVENV
jgi:hypothetical protein